MGFGEFSPRLLKTCCAVFHILGGGPAQQLVRDEVAEEGAVGAAGLAQEASRKYYYHDITTSYAT
jgi:hypothetical protein